MDPAIQTEIKRQQAKMLDKIFSIMDTTVDSLKGQLEETSNSQMTELKCMQFFRAMYLPKEGSQTAVKT